MIQHNGNQRVVDTLKLRQLVSASKLGLLMSTPLSIILAFVQSEVSSIQLVAIWLLVITLVSAYRLMLILNIPEELEECSQSQLHHRLTQFRMSMLASGLAWGAAGYLLLTPQYPHHEVFVIFVLTGLSAGGAVSYAADVMSAAFYGIGIMCPLFFRMLLIEEPYSIWMPFAVAMYMTVLIQGVRRMHHEIMDNILLRLDAMVKDHSIKTGEDRYQLLLEHFPIGVFHFNAQRVITFCNKQLGEILEDDRRFKVGFDLNAIADNSVFAGLKSAIIKREQMRQESLYEDKPEKWVSWLYAPIKDALGGDAGGIGIVQDVTERKQSAKLVEKFALEDYLTELPNRRELINRLRNAISQYADDGRDLALLYIDLDNFKHLNDTLGHAVGDLLLQKVASRLRRSLRQRDWVARAARIGGDEFIIVLEDLSHEPEKAMKQAVLVANKVIKRLQEPFRLQQYHYDCSVSIGLALYSDSKGTVDDFLRHADIAMYEAKKESNTVRVYNQSMLAHINKKASIKRALSRAIKNNEFDLFYQVQVNDKQKPIGVEALIRWIRPKQGVVLPMEFIPVAEETGLIIDIGHWVLDKACQQLKAWAKETDKKHLSISINVSAVQLLEPDFSKVVAKTVKQHKVIPQLLKLEVTESVFVAGTAEVINTMHQLQKIGVGVELDDFGTGYSCLQYLKNLPLKQLKIDRSFIKDIDQDKSDQSIVKTIVAMAGGLNIDVIAEGVENSSQFELLKSYGCQHFQGYCFGKPSPVEVFDAANMKKLP